MQIFSYQFQKWFAGKKVQYNPMLSIYGLVDLDHYSHSRERQALSKNYTLGKRRRGGFSHCKSDTKLFIWIKISTSSFYRSHYSKIKLNDKNKGSGLTSMCHLPSFTYCLKACCPFTTWGHKAVPAEDSGKMSVLVTVTRSFQQKPECHCHEKTPVEMKEMGGGGVREKNKPSKITTMEGVRRHIAGAQWLKSMEQGNPTCWAPSSYFHHFHRTVRVPWSPPWSTRLSGCGAGQALQIAVQSRRLLTGFLPAAPLPCHQKWDSPQHGSWSCSNKPS